MVFPTLNSNGRNADGSTGLALCHVDAIAQMSSAPASLQRCCIYSVIIQISRLKQSVKLDLLRAGGIGLSKCSM